MTNWQDNIQSKQVQEDNKFVFCQTHFDYFQMCNGEKLLRQTFIQTLAEGLHEEYIQKSSKKSRKDEDELELKIHLSIEMQDKQKMSQKCDK